MTSISFTKDVVKFVRELETKPARQIYEKTIALTLNPRPASSTELRAHRGFLRMRVGDFRIIYRVVPDLIEVVLIDKRSDDEVYKQLERLSLD